MRLAKLGYRSCVLHESEGLNRGGFHGVGLLWQSVCWLLRATAHRRMRLGGVACTGTCLTYTPKACGAWILTAPTSAATVRCYCHAPVCCCIYTCAAAYLMSTSSALSHRVGCCIGTDRTTSNGGCMGLTVCMLYAAGNGFDAAPTTHRMPSCVP